MKQGNPEASLVIWRPDQAAKAQGADDVGTLRNKAMVQAAVAYCVAGLVYFFLSHTMAYVAAGAGTVMLLSGLLSPKVAFRALNRVIDGLVLGVGKGTAYILLVPTYYLMIAPLGLLMRRGKGDKLGRTYDPAASSYWTDPEQPAADEDPLTPFTRQF
jgi:hypothetical protein